MLCRSISYNCVLTLHTPLDRLFQKAVPRPQAGREGEREVWLPRSYAVTAQAMLWHFENRNEE